MTALNTLIESAMAAQAENTHTAIPGVVTGVKGNFVNVKPSLSRALRSGAVEELPVIPNVPIWFPQGGGASITWPVSAGDGCLLVFSERSLDEWKGSGAASTPNDPRKHALSDAIALVGLNPSTAPSDGITLTMGGVSLTVSASGVAITGGTVTHNGTNIGSDHVHGGVLPGGADTEGPK